MEYEDRSRPNSYNSTGAETMPQVLTVLDGQSDQNHSKPQQHNMSGSAGRQGSGSGSGGGGNSDPNREPTAAQARQQTLSVPATTSSKSNHKLREVCKALMANGVVTLQDPNPRISSPSSNMSEGSNIDIMSTNTSIHGGSQTLSHAPSVITDLGSVGGMSSPATPTNRHRNSQDSTTSRSTSPTSFRGDGYGSPTPPFYVIRILGTGAYGTALLAKHLTANDKMVCIKLLKLAAKPANQSEERRRVRALSEVSCMKKCEFFSLVGIYDSGIVDHRSFSSPRKVAQLREAVSEARKGEGGDMAVMSRSPGQNNIDVAAEGNNGAATADEKAASNEETLYIVMEYADCGDMRQEIKFRSKTNDLFHEREAALLFIQLLLGVHHMHERGIIHRDIKTANVFMISNGLIKLGDFGFAKEYDPNEPETAFLGTPYYLACEVWKRQPYDQKVDVFAIGVVFYELLTLQRPFKGNDVRAVRHAVENGKYDPLPNTITSDTRDAINWMLTHDAAGRPTTAQLLQTQYIQNLLTHFLRAVRANELIEPDTKKLIVSQVQHLQIQSPSAWPPKGHTHATPQPPKHESPSEPSSAPQPHPPRGDITTIYEGTVMKETGNGAWKERYLRLQSRGTTVELVMAVSQAATQNREKCIATPVSEFSRVVHDDSNTTERGFLLLSKRWKKLRFTALSNEDHRHWMDIFSQYLGVSE